MVTKVFHTLVYVSITGQYDFLISVSLRVLFMNLRG